MSITKKVFAEFFGTFWLTFGGCGSAIFAAVYTTSLEVGEAKEAFPFSLGIGFTGVSLAFGLTVLTMAYAVGHISGGHFNPAVSFGLWAGKRFPSSELLPYIIAQVVGAIVAAGLLFVIASGNGTDLIGDPAVNLNPLATNGYGNHSPGQYSLVACLIAEFLLTMMFLLIILGATDKRAPQGFAPVAIGLGLTLIHLISIPITNTSVNPARSTGPALIVALAGNMQLFQQVWLFWVAPIAGAIAAGFIYNVFFEADTTATSNADRSFAER
ncbi:aquaporin Z [Acaryochloris sp. 'Moss Beach']|uniref:aquaporin Z n=1 Tax=Acaryochloris TaxID=155977 RepID=UPI001BAFE0F4|nr:MULTISPECIES: aquaporin Z [Acaryochloris]QUY42933.1 aquaporin Z [Acaryochloris marina S15]UJB67822.1 aquaporin Z [Acaryochloris sp. 'Moss Beach']